jgi:hypothetical protein
MKNRWLINLLLFVLIGSLILIGVLLYQSQKPPVQKVLMAKVVPQEINEIRIRRRDHPEVWLIRVGDVWKLKKPVRARSNRFNVAKVLQISQAPTSTEIEIKNTSELKKYGLHRPHAQLFINQQRIDFGDPHPLNSQQYVRVKDTVYLIPEQYFRVIANPLNSMLSQRLLEPECQPQAFYLPGNTLQHQGGQWQLRPKRKNISTDRINRFVKEWRYASALSVSLYSGMGMKDRLRIVCRASDKRPRYAIPIQVLQYRPELILYRLDEKLQYRLPAGLAQRLVMPFQPKDE